MQWERTDRPTAILMIYQSHRSTWVNFNTWSKWPKGTTPVTSKQHQLTAHNWVRNTQVWVAGDFHSTATCPLTPTGCFGKASGKLSQSDCAQAVTGADKTGLQDYTIFQMPHSHPATQPCDELWTSLPCLEINNLLLPLAPPLHQQTAPPGCLAREHSGGSPEELLHMHI